MAKIRKTKNEVRKLNSKDGRGHPAYIYAGEGDKYIFLGLTHSEITQGVKNIRLDKNPNPDDARSSYVRPRSERSHISTFGKRLKGWFFGDSDKEKIEKMQK